MGPGGTSTRAGRRRSSRKRRAAGVPRCRPSRSIDAESRAPGPPARSCTPLGSIIAGGTTLHSASDSEITPHGARTAQRPFGHRGSARVDESAARGLQRAPLLVSRRPSTSGRACSARGCVCAASLPPARRPQQQKRPRRACRRRVAGPTRPIRRHAAQGDASYAQSAVGACPCSPGAFPAVMGRCRAALALDPSQPAEPGSGGCQLAMGAASSAGTLV